MKNLEEASWRSLPSSVDNIRRITFWKISYLCLLGPLDDKMKEKIMWRTRKPSTRKVVSIGDGTGSTEEKLRARHFAA